MYCFNGERQWCDFVTWDDRVKSENMIMGITRVDIDIAKQTKIDDSVKIISEEVRKYLSHLYKYEPELYQKVIT